jgi:hypothetical protein
MLLRGAVRCRGFAVSKVFCSSKRQKKTQLFYRTDSRNGCFT